jgi:hypothetical protein
MADQTSKSQAPPPVPTIHDERTIAVSDFPTAGMRVSLVTFQVGEKDPMRFYRVTMDPFALDRRAARAITWVSTSQAAVPRRQTFQLREKALAFYVSECHRIARVALAHEASFLGPLTLKEQSNG